MPLLNIVPSRFEESTEHTHHFTYADNPNAGFAFPCKADGTPLELKPAGLANYRACLTGEVEGRKVRDDGVETLTHRYRVGGSGDCEDCGQRVYLGRFTNGCDCGADYGSNGERLAPREQWGEETGEHWSECL